MNRALENRKLKAKVGALSREEQACFAAQLYNYCAGAKLDNLEVQRMRSRSVDPKEYFHVKATERAAFQFQKEVCSLEIENKLIKLLDETAAEWKRIK